MAIAKDMMKNSKTAYVFFFFSLGYFFSAGFFGYANFAQLFPNQRTLNIGCLSNS